MENGNGDPSSSKDLTVPSTLASVINGSALIDRRSYEENLQQIQGAKELVRRLEINNELGHKNFLIDELERRAKEGRNAEDMLARLRNEGIPAPIPFVPNVPANRPDIILPTTASLVEVPESRSSNISTHSSLSTTSSHPPTTHPDNHRPIHFQHYVPPQRNAPARRGRPPIDSGQTSQRATQNAPVMAGAYPYPIVPTSYGQFWSNPLSQPTAFTTSSVPYSAYYAPPGWVTTAPAQGSSNIGSSHPTYYSSSFPAVSTVPQPSATTYDQSQHLPPFSQVQVPLQQGISSASSGQPPIRPYPQPVQFASTGSSKPPVVSGLEPAQLQQPPQPQRHAQLPQLQQQSQPQQRPQSLQTLHSQHSQQPLQPALQPQQLSHPLQALHSQKLQRLSQPTPQPQKPTQVLHSQQPQQLSQPQQFLQPSQTSHPQQSQQPSQPPLQPQSQQLSQPLQLLPQPQAQRPLQPPLQVQQWPQLPQTQQQQALQLQSSQTLHQPRSELRSQSAESQSNRPSTAQLSQPANPQEENENESQLRSDQAAFTRLFREAAQGDFPKFMAFCRDAYATGISESWIKEAAGTLPPGLWPFLLKQLSNTQLALNAQRQRVRSTATLERTAIGARIPPTTIFPVDAMPVAELPTNPSASVKGQTLPPSMQAQYTAQLQYYALQAAGASSRPSENATQVVLEIPTQDVPQAGAHVRTPKDANKATLARDILRSLGKTVPKPNEEKGGEPAAQANDHGGDLPHEATVPATVPESPSRVASQEQPMAPPTTAVVDITPSIISARPDGQDKPTERSGLEEKQKQDSIINGPIMIDLTLVNSDESEYEVGQELKLPDQTTAHATTTTQTTNHTPLLESLSLEELPPIDAAVESHVADVRMDSPPLSFTGEENIEPELLYPLPTSTETTSSSFEPPPREESERSLDGQLPLFLPSPPVSPARSQPPEVDVEMVVDENESRVSTRHSPEVEEIENDTQTATPPRASKRRRVVYVLVPPAPPYVRKAKLKGFVDWDSDDIVDDEEIQYSRFEQLLIEESKSRLLERRCRWSNCVVILNCAAHLLTHLKNHAREEELERPFLCRWANCQKEFSDERERDVHFERHTIRPLPCPFAGCNEQFDSPVQVMQHEVQHQKAEQREPLVHKSTCQPIVPAIPARLGPPPKQVPSHRVIPRRVFKCRIPAERHAIVGPWVLWNIWSPVDLGARKQNAPMRGRLARQTNGYEMDSADPRRDDYDFLIALSSYPAKNAPLDDLESTESTWGRLTLWGSEGAVTAGNRDEEHASVASDAVAPEETEADGRAQEAGAGDIAEVSPGVGSEGVVEGMVIL